MSPCTAKGGQWKSSLHSQHFSTFVPVSVEARGSTPDAHWKVASGGGGETSEGGGGGGGGEGGGRWIPARRNSESILLGVMMLEPSCVGEQASSSWVSDSNSDHQRQARQLVSVN